MQVKEESEKVGLKLNIQKMKIMASGPINSWQIVGETVETVADFTLGGSKITADGDYSHEIKRHLFLGRKLSAKELMLWTVVLEKTLESPCYCKEIQPFHPKGDQSWVFIGKIDVEAETPIFLATWCEKLTHWKRPWCWERLRAGVEGDGRGRDGLMASPTPWTCVWVDSGSWWWIGRPRVLQFMGSQRVGHDWATELNWTESSIIKTKSTSHGHMFFINPCVWRKNPSFSKHIIDCSNWYNFDS